MIKIVFALEFSIKGIGRRCYSCGHISSQAFLI